MDENTGDYLFAVIVAGARVMCLLTVSLFKGDIRASADILSVNNRLGEGAYGKVYKCSLYHTLVEIKVHHPDVSDRKEKLLREGKEFLKMRRLPQICSLLGLF
ncbi:hypothetical protein BUALT_Bualt04G0069900 [Buddleja alternifolia]|uniref:Protein kinase domain-containing protein n=1 Tax=Buddleja alternifolia TaxID=168488 RepID=A0AAV6XV15_9LAMI|nr:hypothetical protein BUALT_Bualt04G0069900 [Buddleja alternifolia]